MSTVSGTTASKGVFVVQQGCKSNSEVSNTSLQRNIHYVHDRLSQ